LGNQWRNKNEEYQSFFSSSLSWPYLEDPDTFLFEFEVVCKTYDYAFDAQKLNIFPSTLKESTLRWFMSLEGNNIKSWEKMK
jgi:hypothetical protein